MIEFDQYTEYLDTTGVHPVALDQHALDVLSTLTTLHTAYAHAATLGRPAVLDAAELDAVKVTAPYHADVIANEIADITDPAQIVANLIAVRSRPEWYVGLACVAADPERTKGVYFNAADANLYACIQAHKAQADWRPDLPGLAALWTRFYTEEWPEWVQPYGAQDAYNIGDKITFNEQRYISLIDANVWSPAVYPAGWELQA